MLSLTAEHAVRAMIYLAQTDGQPTSAQKVATALGAPANYLAKTLAALARRGLLHSVRGTGGGFNLAHDPEQITLGAIVDVFRESRPEARCLMAGDGCGEAAPCPIHENWLAIRDDAARRLGSTTIADLLAGSTPRDPVAHTANGD